MQELLKRITVLEKELDDINFKQQYSIESLEKEEN